ncbi:McrC family protein [Kitasatospora phosalacinea]|uniref:McrC family protein n=1 Tax=Kitasatospora phosalacinea TaxID=2065 RepID=UPI0036656923
MRSLPERSVGEYGSLYLAEDELTGRDLARLRELQARKRLTLAAARPGWVLTAGATVGVLVLDRLRLVVEPKTALTGEQLVRWLCYALATPVPHRATLRGWATDRTGYADLVAAALLAECRTLLRDGLRRDYLAEDRVEPVLRGRLDVTAQATRRYGMLDKLHVRTFERRPDVWENRICGTALAAAVTGTADPALARALADLASAFPADATPNASLRALDRARYHRLNARYRPAHTWAGLVLRGGGVTGLLADGEHHADSLLLDLPRLWEEVVRRLAAEAARPLGGRIVPSRGSTAIRKSGDLSPHPGFHPDVLLDFGSPGTGNRQPLFPLDAKYKQYDERSVSSSDVHQLLTYTAGYRSGTNPCSAIVYPSPGGLRHRTLRVAGPHGPLGTVHVLGLDTSATPERCAAAVRELCLGDPGRRV